MNKIGIISGIIILMLVLCAGFLAACSKKGDVMDGGSIIEYAVNAKGGKLQDLSKDEPKIIESGEIHYFRLCFPNVYGSYGLGDEWPAGYYDWFIEKDDKGYRMSLQVADNSMLNMDYLDYVDEEYVSGLARLIKDMDIAQNNGMYLQQGDSSFGYDLYVKYESGESLSVKAYGDASSTCVFDIPRLMEYAAIKVPGYGEPKPDGYFAEAFAEGQVENNGGLFVRVGKRVYFRIYDPQSLDSTSYGDVFIGEIRSDLPSELMYYDLETKENVKVCDVAVIGKLYATVDGICVASYPDGYMCTALIDEYGGVNERFMEGTVIAVSPDGRSVAIGESDEEDNFIPALYRDGNRIGTPADKGEDGELFSDTAFVEDVMTGTVKNRESNRVFVYSYDADGEYTTLGEIRPYDMETYTLSPQADRITAVGDKGYITAGFRDGTADITVAWSAYEFKCGEAESLEMMDSGEVGQVYDYRIPAVLADSDGNTVLSAHPQNEVYLSKHPDGNLMCITKSGEKIIRSGYIDSPGENEMYTETVESGVCFDDMAFIIKVNAERYPEEDMGFHRAYKLRRLTYDAIDVTSAGDGSINTLHKLEL